MPFVTIFVLLLSLSMLLIGHKNAKLGTGRSSRGIEGYGGGPLWR